MRSAVGGLKAAALVVLLAAGLSACQQGGAEEAGMTQQYEADVAEARASAQRAAQAAEQAAQSAQRAEAAAAAAQRAAETSSRMFQQGVRK